MATALAAQLAQIRAQTTNSLDLKAQKKAHSESLLFDSRVAATQDFDTIYQLCYEGFEELCRLDLRFTAFASNLFSEQSKQEDRTQMSSAQNEQLDLVLDSFLALVGSKLLLKPALKAVEWLVRRFRVHEYNTLCYVLTFLPYHNTPMFPTMLSILPQKLPSVLKFLAPYIQSLASLPRHAIVYAASTNKAFLTAWSSFVHRCSSQGYQYPTMISVWASVATEAVAAMIDQARSTRREAQRQNQHDVLILILPILNDGLSLIGSPELRVGCYMILTVLACKTSLDDRVLSAMMKAVASDWKETSHAGLICLSVLAQQRRENKLPKKVCEALVLLDGIEDDLVTLKQQYKVDKLALGMVLGVVSRVKKSYDERELRLLKTLFEGQFMEDTSMKVALRSLLTFANSLTTDSEIGGNFDIQGPLTDLVSQLADSQETGKQMQSIIEDVKLSDPLLRERLQIENSQDSLTQPDSDEPDDVIMEDAEREMTVEYFNTLTSGIPARTTRELSFLSHCDSYIYKNLVKAFVALSTPSNNTNKFSDLPVLRKSSALTEPLFFSFFIHVWCGNNPAQARATAIKTVDEILKNEALTADVQILLPYVLYGLADASSYVRRTTVNLVLTLSKVYTESDETSSSDKNLPVLGREEIYGQSEESKRVTWLTRDDVTKFIKDLLVPGLEECLLDRGHISQLLSDNINGSKHNAGSVNLHKELKSSLRLSIFAFLCSHVVHTPLLALQRCLLPILNRIERVGSTPRTKLLLPLLSTFVKLDGEMYARKCEEEQVDPIQLVEQVVGIVVPTDREGIQALKPVIEGLQMTSMVGLRAAALQRIRVLWSSIKPDLQLSLAETFIDLAVPNDRAEKNDLQDVDVIETLRVVPLSTAILNSFLIGLPTVSSNLHERTSSSKRRRLSHNQSSEATGLELGNPDFAVRRITFVLELVETSKVERHPELLKGLFRVMADLQHSQAHTGAATAYLQVLTMDSLLAIVRKAETTSNFITDVSSIRADVLIDCIRTTASPQVRNVGLLLISALANVTPELILHSVMPVFTFLGANVMSQEDDFSTHVVKKTMESVIPRLVQSLHKRKGHPLIGVSELLLSFAAAFEHIPPQRRLGLYTSLVDKIDPEAYLYAFLAILLDKYPNNAKVVQFAVEITSQYDAKTQLQMVDQYMATLLDAWKPKPSVAAVVLSADGKHNAETINANLLPLVPEVLRNEDLRLKLSKRLTLGGEGASAIRDSYAQILEQILALSDTVKSKSRLESLSMQALDASLGLVPLPDMVATLEMLLSRTQDNTRLQVLRSFENRLQSKKVDMQAAQGPCLRFLARLVAMIKESSDVPLKQIAISCADRVVEQFGKKGVEVVLESARVVASERILEARDAGLRTNAFLCLATMVEVAADALLPILPVAFSRAMSNLEYSISAETENAPLHNSVYSFLAALLFYVPWMITGPDLDRLLKGSHESANAGMGKECGGTRIETMKLIAGQIEAKECFAALDRNWTSAMTEGPIAVKEHLEVLRLAIDRQPKSSIVKQSEILGDFFLKAFDLRRIQLCPRTDESYENEEIELVEAAVNDAAMAMVYKLNDAAFRPMFIRFVEWATGSVTQKNKRSKLFRQSSVYTFILKLFDTLKSIVTSYTSYILDDAAEILQNISPNDEDSMHLWRLVIQTLRKSFEHDQDDFYQTPTHFAPISSALLSLLPHAPHLTSPPLITTHVIPAIASLATATDSPTHHKSLNAAILKHMRSDRAAVRLAAVQCERELTDRLGEEWLALLPEMLPFISEAQEDEDEEVERETIRWVRQIEEVLGESLGGMLG